MDPDGDVDADRLLWALATFPGIGRRLERKGEARGVVVYDDYGHHPTAIRATLAALRQREPDRRVWAVYEPLTFHRTAAMLDDFADALAEADARRRSPTSGRAAISDTSITSPERSRPPSARAGRTSPPMAPGSVEDDGGVARRRTCSEGDAVLVMGGGRSYRIAELLLEALDDRIGTARLPRGSEQAYWRLDTPQLRCGQHAAPAQGGDTR